MLFERSLLAFVLLILPALTIEFWFERVGRPSYTQTSNGQELHKAGEDLEAKGLTEWMWDVVYYTWGVTVVAALVGNWAWWLYVCSFWTATISCFGLTDVGRLSYLCTRPGWPGRPSRAQDKGWPAWVEAMRERARPQLDRASGSRKWKSEVGSVCSTAGDTRRR